MTDLTAVDTTQAPKAIGPYSQAIRSKAAGMTFLSGQIAIDPSTGAMIGGDVADETRQVLANLNAVLIAGGLARWNVVKTTIYLVDMDDFGVINEVYAEYFGDNRPARATVQVAGLPKGARVEIDAIAVD
ncbi:MAG: RidA family protein [Deltaproteobacteria bacterium]|nr:RidA family protein [Deltaproteobacteria bacterium]